VPINLTSLRTQASLTGTSVTISLPAPSYTVIVLSQLDSRYFKDLDTQAQWSFDFMLFKKGEPEPIAPSLYSMLFYARSVNLEIDLAAGEYVVHVRLDRQVYEQVSGYCFRRVCCVVLMNIFLFSRRQTGRRPSRIGTRGSLPESSPNDARVNLSLLVSQFLPSFSVSQISHRRLDFKLE
jgi:hypothetical protein